MRTLFLTLIPLLFSAALSAQGVFSNKTQSTLEKVIQDYPNHFYNIKGELIGQTHQQAEYKSTLQLPGSTYCTITLYNVTREEEYNWTCSVYEAGSFEEAKNRFKEIYDQIGNCIITTGGHKTFILSGQYENPGEDKKLTQVVFSLLPGIGQMKKLRVELSLQQQSEKKWKILLSVNDRDPKEEERTAMGAASGGVPSQELHPVRRAGFFRWFRSLTFISIPNIPLHRSGI